MPYALLNAHAEMLTRISAEEELRASNATAYGSGSMKREDAASYIRTLRREASGEEPQLSSPIEAARAMGIQVVRKSRAANS